MPELMSVLRPLMDRLRAEGGFTLPELLTAILVGTIIMLATYTVLDGTMRSSESVLARTDASQRGRIAMEEITRQLRSQTCPSKDLPALEDARPASVTFYSDIGPEQYRPDRYVLTYANRTFMESIYQATGTEPAFAWPAQPTTYRNLGTGLDPVGTTPVFRYYAFSDTVPPRPDLELVPPAGGSLSALDRARVVNVKVSFVSRPSNSISAQTVSTFVNDVYARTASPLDPTEGPQCI